jgi:alpha-galactosidase
MMPQPRGHGGWVESGIGPEVEITSDLVMQFIEAAAGVGAELFFIDASWYAAPGRGWWDTVGDWTVSRERFPDGIAPFRERAHSLGMLFGLWMDDERLQRQGTRRNA